MGNSNGRKTQEQIEDLLANITANAEWNRYRPDLRTQFIIFRDGYYGQNGHKQYAAMKLELLKLIDSMNSNTTLNALTSKGGDQFYQTFVKDFVELHRLLVRLETIEPIHERRAHNQWFH